MSTSVPTENRIREEQEERIGAFISGHPLDVPWRYARNGPAAALVVTPLVLGLAHMGLRAWILDSSDLAGGFLGLLIGATFLLVSGMRGLKRYVDASTLQFFYHARPDASYEELRLQSKEFVARIFDDRRMTWTGVVYGALVAAAPFVLDLGPPQPLLRGSLALFLFSVNFAAGIGFYGLVLFFVQLWHARRLVRVSVWHRRNRSTDFIDAIRIRTALLVSAYTALSFSSVVVSDIPLGQTAVAAYFIFAASIVLAAFAVPGAFIRRRLDEEKLSALAAIDRQLDAEFGRAMARAHEPGEELDLSKIEGLIALRKRVDGLGIWPMGWRTVRTGIGVVLMSALPIFLQRILGSP